MSQTPPPPPGAPAGGAGFNVGDAISYGWVAYWKNVGPMMLITLVIFAVQFTINVVASTTHDDLGNVVLQLVGILVGIILVMGLFRATLAVCEGRKPEVSMLLLTDGFFNYLVASMLYWIGVVIGLFLFIVPGIIFALVFMYFGFSIVQQPELGPLAAMKRSADITRGHRPQLFGLVLVLLLINIVGVLACLIGVLFTYGITVVAVAYAYKTLSGQAVAPPA